jgi:ubiquinone/menaquinone biosynthesis C-methylase UbiE
MRRSQVEHTLIKLGTILNDLAPYRFIKSSALLLQGVQVEAEHEYISVQWDLFESVYTHFHEYTVTPIVKTANHGQFMMSYEGLSVQVECQFNVTVRTDPYHINIMKEGSTLWVHSLYAYLYDDNQYEKEVHNYLSQVQAELTQHNQLAWNQDQYNALVQRYGEPQVMAEKIIDNPEWRLHPFYRHISNVKGKKIVHLLGSNGIKGVALSLLEAQVTIVDFSKENATYAKELASRADVSIEYLETDVFSIPKNVQNEDADFVLMELGVLHYFVDLHLLVRVIKSILKQGGTFILHEFHPVSTKLITSAGKKHKVTGNYFTPTLESQNVAFSKHMEEHQEKLVKVSQRRWTLGEVVTAIAQVGLVIKRLEEEPNHKINDIGLPKTYTIIAEKV